MGLLLCARPPCLFVCLDVAKLSKGRGNDKLSVFLSSREFPESCGKTAGAFFPLLLSCSFLHSHRKRKKKKKDKRQSRNKKEVMPPPTGLCLLSPLLLSALQFLDSDT